MTGPTDIAGGTRRGLWKGPALITALIVLIPLVRNLLVSGFDWDLRGALVVASFSTLLFSAGLASQAFFRKLFTPTYRAGVGVALGASFLLVWSNFVHVADDVNPEPDDLLYLAVPIVGLVGAALARFRPEGMGRALFVAALAQGLVFVLVLSLRDPHVAPWTPALVRGFVGNAALLLLLVGAALLFRKAGRVAASPG